jgi:hypothetical protein
MFKNFFFSKRSGIRQQKIVSFKPTFEINFEMTENGAITTFFTRRQSPQLSYERIKFKNQTTSLVKPSRVKKLL